MNHYTLALALALAFTDYNADPPRRPAWPHGFAASLRRVGHRFAPPRA
ncbi:hypothetical protein [Burkholderia pseudomallei]